MKPENKTVSNQPPAQPAAPSSPHAAPAPLTPPAAHAPPPRPVAASEATIRGEFASRSLNAEGQAQCLQVRQILSDTLTLLEQRVPEGIYRLRITEKLEEAGLLAVKAVSLKPEVQG